MEWLPASSTMLAPERSAIARYSGRSLGEIKLPQAVGDVLEIVPSHCLIVPHDVGTVAQVVRDERGHGSGSGSRLPAGRSPLRAPKELAHERALADPACPSTNVTGSASAARSDTPSSYAERPTSKQTARLLGRSCRARFHSGSPLASSGRPIITKMCRCCSLSWVEAASVGQCR
jgi:hypothetical protein